MVMQIRGTPAVQMQMLTTRIFQGCQHATAFFWLGNVMLGDAHLKGSNWPMEACLYSRKLLTSVREGRR